MIGSLPVTAHAVNFHLPPERSASEPPEARGLARDQVRLLVATPQRLRHARFRDLGDHLRPKDLVVINTSATLPAALDGVRNDGHTLVVHVAGPHPSGDGSWVIEPRRSDGLGPIEDTVPGQVIAVAGGREFRLEQSYPDADSTGSRLWRARPRPHTTVDGQLDLIPYLEAHGRPITYGYLPSRWPLDAYQTVFARTPGSAEMASAGRPFTRWLIADLITRGIAIAPIELHAGVSSLETGEDPPPERYEVPEVTARLVGMTRRSGGRVIAVGTTVARALETAIGDEGRVRPGGGWTELVLGPDHEPRVVDGLITGWHPPDASHLRLLEAVAGPTLVQRAYDAALASGYLWHEFGDSCLLLPR